MGLWAVLAASHQLLMVQINIGQWDKRETDGWINEWNEEGRKKGTNEGEGKRREVRNT